MFFSTYALIAIPANMRNIRTDFTNKKSPSI